MSQSSFSLCSKCGNIKPAGSSQCEFCSSAQSVSLGDLKQGLKGTQADKPADNAPMTAPVVASQPGSLGSILDSTDWKEPVAGPSNTNPSQSLQPSSAEQAKPAEPERPRREIKTEKSRFAGEDAGLPSKPNSQAATGGGFIGWLRRLFKL